MAEIDKALPNVKKSTIELPGEDVISEAIQEQLQQEQEAPDNIEIVETEEGGAEISFDPSKAMAEGSQNHFANLAEYLDDDVLGPLGSELKEMYLDYDIENAWAKKQNIALRLHQQKHDELKTKYLHQALTVAIMLSEENDLFFNSKFSEKGSGILASTKHKNPTIETLWSLGNELDEDFSHYFPNVEVFTGELVFEVELWSPELTWMIKDPESKSRWDYAKLALDNSGIKYEDLDMHTDDDEDLDN